MEIVDLLFWKMKFGKSLSNQIEETLPEWRDKFLSYKELKKRLKLIEPNKPGGEGEERPQKKRRMEEARREGDAMTEEEVDFLKLLEDELDKFNSFFVEKEEEYIIRLKVIYSPITHLILPFLLQLLRLPFPGCPNLSILLKFCVFVRQQ